MVMHNNLTGSLEDYLEAILKILGTSSVARVRDIADELHVSPASVTPAMKRLAELGLVRYSKRNYIGLTGSGREIAMRTAARHSLLARFLTDVLGSDAEQADTDACAMEHHISEDSMERLAALLEFLYACPELEKLMKTGFARCFDEGENGSRCSKIVCPFLFEGRNDLADLVSLASLEPGHTGMIVRIAGDRALRKSLINKGFIHGTEVLLLRRGTESLPYAVKVAGHELDLPKDAVSAVLLNPRSINDET